MKKFNSSIKNDYPKLPKGWIGFKLGLVKPPKSFSYLKALELHGKRHNRFEKKNSKIKLGFGDHANNKRNKIKRISFLNINLNNKNKQKDYG